VIPSIPYCGGAEEITYKKIPSYDQKELMFFSTWPAGSQAFIFRSLVFVTGTFRAPFALGRLFSLFPLFSRLRTEHSDSHEIARPTAARSSFGRRS
jgi:hypothetical protein